MVSIRPETMAQVPLWCGQRVGAMAAMVAVLPWLLAAPPTLGMGPALDARMLGELLGPQVNRQPKLGTGQTGC